MRSGANGRESAGGGRGGEGGGPGGEGTAGNGRGTGRADGRGGDGMTAVQQTERRPVGILAAMLALAIGVGLAWSWQRQVMHVASRYLEAMANIRAPIKWITLT